jgi:hypothetical protein
VRLAVSGSATVTSRRRAALGAAGFTAAFTAAPVVATATAALGYTLTLAQHR